MSNSELNYLEEVIELSNMKDVTPEEINTFLSFCPDNVKEAFEIITQNKPNYVH